MDKKINCPHCHSQFDLSANIIFDDEDSRLDYTSITLNEKVPKFTEWNEPICPECNKPIGLYLDYDIKTEDDNRTEIWTGRHAVRALFKYRHATLKKTATDLGWIGPSGLSRLLRRGTLGFERLNSIVKTLGFDLVFIPKDNPEHKIKVR